MVDIGIVLLIEVKAVSGKVDSIPNSSVYIGHVDWSLELFFLGRAECSYAHFLISASQFFQLREIFINRFKLIKSLILNSIYFFVGSGWQQNEHQIQAITLFR